MTTLETRFRPASVDYCVAYFVLAFAFCDMNEFRSDFQPFLAGLLLLLRRPTLETSARKRAWVRRAGLFSIAANAAVRAACRTLSGCFRRVRAPIPLRNLRVKGRSGLLSLTEFWESLCTQSAPTKALDISE